MKENLSHSKNTRKNRFGSDKKIPLGSLLIRLHINDEHVICVAVVHIVNAGVPFLVGLDVLGKYKYFVRNISNFFTYANINIHVTLHRK